MEKLKLRLFRASLGLTQKRLAEDADISVVALVDIEKNRVKPRALTAYSIIEALNTVLREKGREEITIDSFDWHILGDVAS